MHHNQKGKRTYEVLEKPMDAIKSETTSLKWANILWNIPLTSLSYH
jgi:hypothetical protein